MGGIYKTLKKLVPTRIRMRLKPFYMRWALRRFTQPAKIWIKKHRFFIWLDPENKAVDDYIFIHGHWELDIAKIIEEHLCVGEIFIDIGANIGYFSLLGASIVGPTGRVIAFEPISRVADQFRMSVQANNHKNVEISNMALGAKSAVMKLEIMPGNVGGSSLVKNIGSGHSECVKVSTLDNELADFEDISVIKIDVEGYEYEVLKGAQETIKKYKPTIIMEFSPSVYGRQKVNNSRNILSLLLDHKYQIRDLDYGYPCSDIDEYLQKLGTKQTNLLLTYAP